MSIAIGCALEPAIPFAFAHELIRQRKRDLTLIGPISDILFDQLIGAGCVARVEAAWVGNVSAGLGHCYRRALEQGEPRRIEVRDHSNFSIAQALLAGAIGAQYIATKTLLGSDIARTNPTFKESTSPFDGSKELLVPRDRPRGNRGAHAEPRDRAGHEGRRRGARAGRVPSLVPVADVPTRSRVLPRVPPRDAHRPGVRPVDRRVGDRRA
ncbi:MAG: hypothetical protein E6I57_10730 [Chloroflexi bacterium]|nr:MAG: hypothetical protein E6I57_10730 [Chloroflexota bacterium]